MAEIDYPQRWLKEALAVTSPEGWRKQITNELLKCQKGLESGTDIEVIPSKYGLRFAPNDISEDTILLEKSDKTSLSFLNNPNYKITHVDGVHKINFIINVTETIEPINIGFSSTDIELYNYYNSLSGDETFIKTKNTILNKLTRVEQLEINGIKSGAEIEFTKNDIIFVEDGGRYYFIVLYYIIPYDQDGLYMSSLKMDFIVDDEVTFSNIIETICDQFIME